MGQQSLPRIQTDDRRINQIQDALAAAVNPVLQQSAQGATVVQFFQTLPVASVALRGVIVCSKPSAGDPCIISICVPNSAGGYEWVGLGSST